MAHTQDFDKSKHPMATIEGKGNRFVPKGDRGTASHKDTKEKIKDAIRKYSDEPTRDIAEYGGLVETAEQKEARKLKRRHSVQKWKTEDGGLTAASQNGG